MATDKELLEDISFDREVAPKDQEGDLLVGLLKRKAYDEKSAVDLAKFPVREEFIDRLIKEDRIRVFANSPMKVFLSPIGKMVAMGEFALRRRETRHNI